MTRKQRRLVLIGVVGGVLAVAVGLVLFAMSSQITLFRTPTELVQQTLDPNQRIRVGGLVEMGSVVRGQDAEVTFQVTDTANTVKIAYKGILPDLFREGQGVVAEGVLQNGVFMADTVLAKHDERYMPKEVVESLKKQGVWREGEPGGPVPGSAKQ